MSATIKCPDKRKVLSNQPDTAWKDILDMLFQDFVAYCLPKFYDQVDWSRGIIFLDKELHGVTKESLGPRVVDKLAKVFLKDGQEQRILVHVEVQGTHDAKLPQRMFTYSYRLYDRYQVSILSCVILTDENIHWRPNNFEIKTDYSKLSLEYWVIKLFDYCTQVNDLENSTNPFANVIYTQLKALEAKKLTPEEKFNVKLQLTKRLYTKKFTKEQIKGLYLFLDWLMTLPEDLEIKYKDQVYQLEEGQNMGYVSNIERMGIEKGRELGFLEGKQLGIQEGKELGIDEGKVLGIQEGKELGIGEGRALGLQEGEERGILRGEAAVLLRQLSCKFKKISIAIKRRINSADANTLLLWSERILKAKTVEEVFID